MATKIASLFAEVGADISGLQKGLGKAKTEMSGAAREMGKSGTKLADQIDSAFKAASKGFTTATASIVGIGVAMNKAFDLGEQGAAITQTQESFDRLMRSVGAAPNILQQLRDASKNTVSDFDLMASTMTLMAGTTGDFATSMANATPQLLEIAKAANKLNPTLGDTQFLYDSLARGIKRSSPLILDNLGLVIKMGEAQQNLADQLGKSVDDLTGQEKQMATLNEVMRAGAVLIEQAGDSTDSATDAFQRLDAATGNLANSLKEKLAPGLASAAEAAVTLLTWNDQIDDAMRSAGAGILNTSQSYEEYSRALEGAAQTAGLFINAEGDLVRISGIHGQMTEKVVEANYRLEESTWAYQRAINAVTEPIGNLSSSMLPLTTSFFEAQNAAIAAAGGFTELSTAASTVAGAFGELEFTPDALWELALASGASLESLSVLAEHLGIASNAEIEATLKTYELVEAFGAGKITADELAAGFSQTGRDAFAAQLAIEGTTQAVDEMPSDKQLILEAKGFAQAEAAANRVTAAVNGIPSYKSVRVQINTYGAEAAAQFTGGYGRQGGGMVHEAVTQINEKGHELIALPTGSMVIPHERSERMMGGGPTWNGDIVVQGNNPETTAMAVMQALADRGMIPRVAMR